MTRIEPRINMQIVVNQAYGGFGLSAAACIAIAERKHCGYDHRTAEFVFETHRLYVNDIVRNDADLVAVVRELGTERASASGSYLKIADVTIDVDINNKDGKEDVRFGGITHRGYSG